MIDELPWPERRSMLAWSSVGVLAGGVACALIPVTFRGEATIAAWRAVACTAAGMLIGAAWNVWRDAEGFAALRRNMERRADDPRTPPPSPSIVGDLYDMPFRVAVSAAIGGLLGSILGLLSAAMDAQLSGREVGCIAAVLASLIGGSTGAVRWLMNRPRRQITARLAPDDVPRTSGDVYAPRVMSAALAMLLGYVGAFSSLLLASDASAVVAAVSISVVVAASTGVVFYARSLARRWDTDLVDVSHELRRSLAQSGYDDVMFDTAMASPHDAMFALPVRHRLGLSRRGTSLRQGVLDLHARFEDMFEAESRAREAVDATQRLKVRFMAYMSHDLRNPLNVVLGFSDILGADTANLNAEQRDSVRTVREAAEELMRVVTEILDSARVEAGQLTFHAQYASAPAILSASLAGVKRATRTLGVEFDSHTDAGLPATYIDVARAEQAFVALLIHVARTCSRGTTVKLYATQGVSAFGPDAGPRVRVEIVAEGMHPPEDPDAVFEPFRWRRRESGRHRRGLGYGLSLARALLELQGAEVGFEHTPRGGGRFWVMLPVRPPERVSA